MDMNILKSKGLKNGYMLTFENIKENLVVSVYASILISNDSKSPELYAVKFVL